MSSESRNHLGVFAKYWQPGQVKTRLAAQIGHESAASIYKAFVQILTKNLAQSGSRRTVYYWPDDSQDAFRALVGNHWDLHPQSPGDLGERMADFFTNAFQQPQSKVVLIGTDSPWIDHATIDSAFAALDRNQIVLGPSVDGGYYLIGMSQLAVEIFSGVEWSTTHVLSQTLSIAQTHCYSVHQLPVGNDIDTLDDLHQFYDALQQEMHPSPEMLELQEIITQQLRADRP